MTYEENAKSRQMEWDRRRSEFVDALLRVMEGSLSCLVELPDVDVARDFWKKFRVYNRMDQPGILRLIDVIDREMPRMKFPGDNPNNGNHAMRISIGNESSAVMYVKLGKFYTKGREAEVKRAWDLIQKAAKAAGADEVDDCSEPGGVSVGGFPYEGEWIFRIWWD
jgi:hypothetical protein